MLGYNRMTGYNKARYNAEGTELSQADSVTVTDSGLVKSILKTIADLVVMSDTQAKSQNKSITDSIKVEDWARIKRDDANKWGDE